MVSKSCNEKLQHLLFVLPLVPLNQRQATGVRLFYLVFRTPSAPDEKSGLEHHYNKAMRVLNTKLKNMQRITLLQ